jgi:uncharacterized membrane protein YeaQ/YmgE (transglycosylase-associated protein family)
MPSFQAIESKKASKIHFPSDAVLFSLYPAPCGYNGKEPSMGIESIVVFLIVGAIAGWLAGLIVSGFGFGLLGNIVVGMIGALIAGALFPRLGFGVGGGVLWAIIHATLGAVILLALIRIVKRA